MNTYQTSHDLINAVLQELSQGRPIILSDDADRENEGDLVYIASKIKKESVSFMMEHGKGLICMSITEKRMKDLGLSFQVEHNESMFGTNFASPFDHISVCSSGISASSRARSILEASNNEVRKEDFHVPGFTIPVVARAGGVLKRRGQTEGSTDLSRLAGFEPYAVICEIMDSNGNMIRGSALDEYARMHKILSCTIEDLLNYRMSFETSIRLVEEIKLPISSIFRNLNCNDINPDHQIELKIYHDDIDDMEHFSVKFGEITDKPTTVRIHSECLTGDVFGSLRCDCGPQLDYSISQMAKNSEGVLIYLQQEGRGIGLANKLRAYELQEKGLDTVDANLHLGLPADGRDYRVAANILSLMGLNKISLMTNNPLKLSSIEAYGIKVQDRIPIVIKPHKENLTYLKAKKERMGHILDGLT